MVPCDCLFFLTCKAVGRIRTGSRLITNQLRFRCATTAGKWTTGNDPAPPVWKTGMLPVTPCPHMPEISTSNIFPFGRLVNGVDSPSLMGKEPSSRFQGSNLGPSACKADALPAELNRDRSRQRGLNPHSLRWQRSAIADFAMPAYGRRKCLFLSPLFSFVHLFC